MKIGCLAHRRHSVKELLNAWKVNTQMNGERKPDNSGLRAQARQAASCSSFKGDSLDVNHSPSPQQFPKDPSLFSPLAQAVSKCLQTFFLILGLGWGVGLVLVRKQWGKFKVLVLGEGGWGESKGMGGIF